MKLMSPTRTLTSCGSSSSRVRRSSEPKRVTRGSRACAHTGPVSFSASAPIDRNFRRMNTLPLRPRRGWRNSTGPGESSLMPRAITPMSGMAITSATKARLMSSSRLMISVRGVFTKPSEKISQLGRRSVTRILPVSFS